MDNVNNSYTDDELQEIRQKTFNPELASLINKVTTSSDISEKKEPVPNGAAENRGALTSSELQMRIYKLLFELITDLQCPKRLSFETLGSQDFSRFQDELAELDITRYGIFTFSLKHECYQSIHNEHLDIPYIGIYNSLISKSVSHGSHCEKNLLCISLAGVLSLIPSKIQGPNQLLPLIIFESDGEPTRLANDILSRTGCLNILISFMDNNLEEISNDEHCSCNSKSLKTLQYNFFLMKESVCYVAKVRMSSQSETDDLKGLENFEIELGKKLSPLSAVYRFDYQTVLIFASRDDLNIVQNSFLQKKENVPSLTLHEIIDFHSRNFIDSVYSFAYENERG